MHRGDIVSQFLCELHGYYTYGKHYGWSNPMCHKSMCVSQQPDVALGDIQHLLWLTSALYIP